MWLDQQIDLRHLQSDWCVPLRTTCGALVTVGEMGLRGGGGGNQGALERSLTVSNFFGKKIDHIQTRNSIVHKYLAALIGPLFVRNEKFPFMEKVERAAVLTTMFLTNSIFKLGSIAMTAAVLRWLALLLHFKYPHFPNWGNLVKLVIHVTWGHWKLKMFNCWKNYDFGYLVPADTASNWEKTTGHLIEPFMNILCFIHIFPLSPGDTPNRKPFRKW